jgi:plasmid stabilization system protein ParE
MAPGDGPRTARRLVLPAPAYFVFFRELSEGGIEVITVLHGRMDYRRG